MGTIGFASVATRLLLAVVLGGIIGLERERRRRAAGFRTYMLVCLGAALTMLLGQYEAALFAGTDVSVDVARLGAQVISGVGFLGAGTIIVTGAQEVKGLTTAAGLWASACMGLAVGTGFYLCVIPAFLLIFLCIRFLPYLEALVVERSRNVNVYVELGALDDAGAVIAWLKEQGVQIYDVELTRGQEEIGLRPSAVFTLGLRKRVRHEELLAAMSALEHIVAINEI